MNIRAGFSPFRDVKAFPYGFRKSGDFSLAEADFLTQYGLSVIELEQGTRLPETEDEKHLLDVLAGQDLPKHVGERAWLKYIRLSRHRRAFHTLNGARKHSAANEELTEYNDDVSDIA